MSIWDYLVLAAVAFAVLFAVRGIVRRRKKGGCAGCSGNCSACGLNASDKQGGERDPNSEGKTRK